MPSVGTLKVEIDIIKVVASISTVDIIFNTLLFHIHLFHHSLPVSCTCYRLHYFITTTMIEIFYQG